MFTAGIDIGSSTSKTVILRDQKVLAYSIVPTGAESARSAQRALDEALRKTDGIILNDIQSIVATGYGRVIVSFANETMTELSCHARGANFLFPSVRTIMDMGGQDCKAIRCDSSGHLLNFAMNDKCAAGTGRYLEVMAKLMELPLEAIGELSFQAKQEVRISSTCAVFGQSEVSSLLRQGRNKADIIAGLHTAVAERIIPLLRRVSVTPDFVITGGIAKNAGVVRRVEERIGLKALLPDEPQIVGALGAALFAWDKVSK